MANIHAISSNSNSPTDSIRSGRKSNSALQNINKSSIIYSPLTNRNNNNSHNINNNNNGKFDVSIRLREREMKQIG